MQAFKKPIVIVLIAVTLLAMGWFIWPEEENGATNGYSVGKVRQGRIMSAVSATGVLSPLITVQVGSQVSGTIQKLHVDFNSKVKKDQVIAQIEPSLFEARLSEAEANLRSAEAERNKAKVVLVDAQRNFTRQQRLRKQNLVSESALDTARLNYQSARVDLEIKEAAVLKAKAVRDREKTNLDYTRIVSPIDGVVISRDVDAGQTVAASLQAPTLFTIAQDLTKMQIETDVDEAFIGQIKPGQAVQFTVFAYPKRTFKGKVAQVRLKPKVEAGVVKYNCIVHVDNSDFSLKPGMTATVSIIVARSKNAFKVTSSALRYVPNWPQKKLRKLRRELKKNEAFIWQISNGDLSPIKVRTGIISEKETEVIGDNLKAGLSVALPPKRTRSTRRRKFGLKVL